MVVLFNFTKCARTLEHTLFAMTIDGGGACSFCVSVCLCVCRAPPFVVCAVVHDVCVFVVAYFKRLSDWFGFHIVGIVAVTSAARPDRAGGGIHQIGMAHTCAKAVR